MRVYKYVAITYTCGQEQTCINPTSICMNVPVVAIGINHTRATIYQPYTRPLSYIKHLYNYNNT